MNSRGMGWAGMILLGTMVGCSDRTEERIQRDTRQEADQVREGARETGRDIKRGLNRADDRIERGLDSTGREIREGGAELRRDVNREGQELREGTEEFREDVNEAGREMREEGRELAGGLRSQGGAATEVDGRISDAVGAPAAPTASGMTPVPGLPGDASGERASVKLASVELASVELASVEPAVKPVVAGPIGANDPVGPFVPPAPVVFWLGGSGGTHTFPGGEGGRLYTYRVSPHRRLRCFSTSSEDQK